MTAFLPPNLLALFAPRDPVPYMPPACKLPHEKAQTHNYHGIAQFCHLFEDPVDTPAPVAVETREQRQDRKKREKAEQVAYKLEQEIALWDPTSTEGVTGDPFKTLFVARINYYTSESKLRREFESYGTIKSITLVHNSRDGKPRGYAFIEYEHERDMHSAYKNADGKKIDGRRVLVDVERGRTVKGWLPRRLGGGLGGTRKGGADVNVRHSGRDDSRRDDDRRRRSRSRDRRRRSRSREKKRSRRSRSRSRDRRRSRDRKKSRRSRSRSRERRRDKGAERGGDGGDYDGVRVKEEPSDKGYDQQVDNYNYDGVLVKQEGEDKKPKIIQQARESENSEDMAMQGVNGYQPEESY